MKNLKVHPRMKELYKFFKFNGKVEDIKDYDDAHLNIFSKEILKMIEEGKSGWEDLLPEGVAQIITEKGLFGYKKGLS
ncbi:hypothetical protein CCAN11_780004 [Capnocytophaga canimorsus]|uniref:Uncharacterized protein n=1 Tax=Capnocytophaga canimorsus TaxID=28188 RepID=A0A0B7IRU7_9FLAO|nr:hypothetical protein CCAN11_780004 [Capnocytophaga canimorsus]